MTRQDGRRDNELRKIKITKDYIKYAEGSCLVEFGNTKVITTASVEETVPSFLKGKKKGWVTAEYSMIPRSCKSRVPREASKGKLGGRTHEIQRLIGRSMRTVVNMDKLGERTIWIDCDVIQADGGTRCASVTGSFISLVLALAKLNKDGIISEVPVSDYVAAVSVGMLGGKPALDLDYEEDSNAEVDMNIIMTGDGRFIEVQGTAEREPFTKNDMEKLLALAQGGVEELISIQKNALKGLIR
ncbi:MAG: ribonuclease PH [Candidatus Omnitrophica bacterium]|nr:ribonuclease PH [Candidatus Omnitrophota bacterium]MBU0895400.1 ribonuclease PH [Candidatus Omnitrophota bacterium]MBU1038025.1 ribonuclease PH [Candidatus Omnitrophota bacterium]MBU1808907.1 ribonuclease PH [Candidatus Omnitrophota bacterium]